MKVLKKKYPKGTFHSQKSDGRYIEGRLYANLKLLAKAIKNDMTFLGIGFSSTLEVGTGKSVLFTQIGEVWTAMVNKFHGENITYTQKNIVFRPKDLIDRSFQVPKYSCILVDEWEDAHYWSELGVTLRQFFRKCRQLNLFILIIIPNFFQLPMNYALGRSIFAIDVKFKYGFKRGYYDFYSFNKKRELYIKGKKTQNYGVVKPDFSGEFYDGYGIKEKEYRDAKRKDIQENEIDDKEILSEHDIKKMIYKMIYDRKKLISNQRITHVNLSEVFEVGESTGRKWCERISKKMGNAKNDTTATGDDYIKKKELEKEEEK